PSSSCTGLNTSVLICDQPSFPFVLPNPFASLSTLSCHSWLFNVMPCSAAHLCPFALPSSPKAFGAGPPLPLLWALSLFIHSISVYMPLVCFISFRLGCARTSASARRFSSP